MTTRTHFIVVVALGALAIACAKSDKKPSEKEPAASSKVTADPAKEAPAKEAPAKAAPAPAGDIVDVASGAGSFNTLVAALKAAELVDALKAEGPFTVFAPSDEAFAKLPEGTVEGLLKDKKKLTAILTYHVVAGKTMAADVGKLAEVTTLAGGKLKIDTTNGVKIGAATVVKTDIAASNGVIHVIDTVLIPE